MEINNLKSIFYIENIFEIRFLFGNKLRKRYVPNELLTTIDKSDLFFLQDFGLLHTADFNFEEPLVYLFTIDQIKIGINFNDEILYHPITKMVYLKNSNTFLATSIKNLVYQLAAVELFWLKRIHNIKETANDLMQRLKAIDPFLFEKDVNYYWGAVIEDIEQGLVG